MKIPYRPETLRYAQGYTEEFTYYTKSLLREMNQACPLAVAEALAQADRTSFGRRGDGLINDTLNLRY